MLHYTVKTTSVIRLQWSLYFTILYFKTTLILKPQFFLQFFFVLLALVLRPSAIGPTLPHRWS